MGRRREQGAVPRLLELLGDENAAGYLRTSALDLLGRQDPDPKVIPSLLPYTEDEDSQLRMLAYSALYQHDQHHRPRWLKRIRTDASPFVRMRGWREFSDALSLDAEHFDTWLQDIVRHADTSALATNLFLLSRALVNRGEPGPATAIMLAAIRSSSASALSRHFKSNWSWIRKVPELATAFSKSYCSRGEAWACRRAGGDP
jgi:hypothetical protein